MRALSFSLLLLLVACGPQGGGDDLCCEVEAEHSFDAFDIHGRRVVVTELSGELIASTGAIVWQLKVDGEDFTLTLEPFGAGRRLIAGVADRPRLAVIETAPYFGVSLDLDGVRQPLSNRGTFILDAQQLALQPSPWLPLDLQVLGQLHPPGRCDEGPMTQGRAKAAQAAFDSLVTAKADLFDTFRFRADLAVLSPDDRASIAAAIERWSFAGEPLNWRVHGEVNHAVPLQTPAWDEANDPSNTFFQLGGFFNGHHAYLGRIESTFAANGDALAAKLPFRRLPSWDPGTEVPLEFRKRIEHITNAPIIPQRYVPGLEFCVRFPDLLLFFNEFSFWHDVVHLQIGGTFGIIADSAQAPIFWPWHATIDTFYGNWRQCQP